MAEDFYATLGVPRDADAATIKKAYRKLAKDLHPDKNPGKTEIETRFKAVNRAFQTLSDPKARGIYDEFGEDGLREGFDPERARAYKQWGARGAGGAGRTRAGNVSFEDFGGEDPFAGQTFNGGFDLGELFGRGRRRAPQKGQDLSGEVTIDFMDAIRGTTVELTRGNAPLTVRIPAGADEGSRVRIPWQGGPSLNGGQPGDLLLTIHVKPHPHFRREGDDLHLDVPITLLEAYEGAKIRIPTIEGAVQLKVPAGTQSGTMLRVRGKGVAKKGKTAGDQFVHFIVRVPLDQDPEVARLVRELGQHQKEDVRAHLG
jgi:curved DNA-binding protein